MNYIQPIFLMIGHFFPHLLQKLFSLFTNLLRLLFRSRHFSKGSFCLIKKIIFFDCLLGKFLFYLRNIVYQLVYISFDLISGFRLHRIFTLLGLFTLIYFINIIFKLFLFSLYILDKFLIIQKILLFLYEFILISRGKLL